MKPHSRKDTSFSASSFSETRPLVTRSLMQSSKKDMHANALSARQSIERDPRNHKTSRIVTDSATPAVSINLMLGTMKVDHSKRNNTTRNSTIQQQASQSSPVKTLRNRNPRASTMGVARSSLTIQFVQPKERNANKSISNLKRSNSKKEENILHSACVSPQKIDVEVAETNKIPVFPSKCNELSGKSLAKSASENKLLTSSTLSQKPGSFFDSLKEEKSKMSVSSTNTTAKKKQSVQKILRKNLVSVSQSAKKDSLSSSSQAKIKNKANKTHRVQVSTLDTASQIGSMKSLQEEIPSIETSPLLQPAIPIESQFEAKTPASLRPTRSLTSLKAGQKRGNTPTLPQQPKVTPQSSTRKVATSRSRTDIDQQNKGYSNVINTPSISTDRMSPKLVFPEQRIQQQQQPKVDPLSLKTTYFRPIEDTKLTEYIQSIRNSQKQISRFEYKSTDCLLQEEPQKEAFVSSFSTTLQSLPEQVIQTERNILNNKDINIEKRAETLPEQLLTNRFESIGAYRSNMKESPTSSAQKNRLGNKKSEPSFNYLVQTTRERNIKKKDNEPYRDRKHEKFYEIPRENLIKSARFNNSDENAMFSHESLTIRGLQRSVVTRGPGDKLSPTSTFMRHGVGGGSEINNFSKLDQLLKNFKDEKLNKAEKEKKDQALEDGLFAPTSFGGADEEPSAMLSNLRKSLAKILIVKNE